MANLHNKARYGEIWPQHKIDAYLEMLWIIKPHVVLSGGWAWHFLSPKGHVEYKHIHDHKDCDLMVPARTVATTMDLILGLGFKKVRTRFDHLPSKESFRRYEKVVHVDGQSPFRLTLDFFVKDVPVRQAHDGFLVVEPETLLSFYSTFHTSKSCFAVQAAKRLIDQGIDPQGRPDLVRIPRQAT